MKKIFVFILFFTLFSHAAFAAISASTIWEVRTTGSDTNGGGWIAGGSGTDWSQQDTAQYAVTDGVTNGSTSIVSATANFGTDIVGNTCYIAGGTGSITPGWYQVASRTDATTLVVDRSTGLTAGTGVTINCGGALASIGAAPLVASNKLYIKAGNYTTTATITFSVNNLKIEGYSTTRGDGGKATLVADTMTSSPIINNNANFNIIKNITANCSSLSGCTSFTTITSNSLINNKAMNYDSYGIYSTGSGASVIVGNEVTGGTVNATAGIRTYSSTSTNSHGFIQNNYIHNGYGRGFMATTGANYLYNIVYNMTDDCYYGSYSMFFGNIADTCGGDGIEITASAQSLIKNNILINNTGYGLNSSGTAFPATYVFDGNAYYNNTAGNRHNVDSVAGSAAEYPYTNTLDVTLTANPFVSDSTGNFMLNSTSGGGLALKSTGSYATFPGLSSTLGYADFGAVQTEATSGGAGGAFVFGN